MGIILSDNYWLLLPVCLFIVLTSSTQLTANTHKHTHTHTNSRVAVGHAKL
jgi:hypothetical protein